MRYTRTDRLRMRSEQRWRHIWRCLLWSVFLGIPLLFFAATMICRLVEKKR